METRMKSEIVFANLMAKLCLFSTLFDAQVTIHNAKYTAKSFVSVCFCSFLINDSFYLHTIVAIGHTHAHFDPRKCMRAIIHSSIRSGLNGLVDLHPCLQHNTDTSRAATDKADRTTTSSGNCNFFF